MDAQKLSDIIEKALEQTGGFNEDDCKKIADHFSEGLDAYVALARFILAPEEYSAKEIDDLVTSFITKVHSHISALHGLMANREIPVEDLAHRLISGEKLKPEERKSVKKNGIGVDELIRSICSVLMREGHFPPQAKVWTPGEEVYDGAFLELMKDGHCRFHFQKARELDAFILEEGRCVVLDKVEEAITRYIQWRWKDGIDGIAINFK